MLRCDQTVRPFAAAFVVGLSVFFLAVSLCAQDRRAGSRAHFDAGQRAFRAQRWEDAINEFRQARELDPTPSALVYIARALVHLERLPEAYTTYRSALEEYDRNTTASAQPRRGQALARSEFEELQNRVVRLTLRLCAETSESNATECTAVPAPDVQLDSRTLTNEALQTPIILSPGAHTIGVSAAGFVSLSRSHELTAGEQTLRIALQPVPPPPPPPPIIEPAPTPPPPIEPAPMQPPTPPPSRIPLIVGASLLGVGAIGVTSGIILWRVTDGHYQTSLQTCMQMQCSAQRAQGEQLQLGTNIALFTGIGVGAVGVGLLVWHAVAQRPRSNVTFYGTHLHATF